MASPIHEGTLSASMITSKEVDIVSERITMNIDSEFRSCDYIIDYIIESDTSGVFLPLAFTALDYKNQFEIYFNNVPIQLINCDTCYSLDLSLKELIEEANDSFFVDWNDDDLKYFIVPLTKGIHNVRVQYSANVWTDLSDWSREYSFRYSLSPAETWKSFGTLQLDVNCDRQIKCNLGLPSTYKGDKHRWNFSEFPGKILVISHQIEPHWLAKILIIISPEGLWLIFSILILVIHSCWIRKVNKIRRPIYALEIVGISFILVIVGYVFYLFTYPTIDLIIGEEASRYHGYYFLMILILPVILLFHWAVIHGLNIKWRNGNSLLKV